MQSNHDSHVKRIIVGLIVVAVFGFTAKQLLKPKSFGIYGHYRADAIEEAAMVEVRHGTNASCLTCHRFEAGIHLSGKHQTISCEFCHGTYADHVKDGKKIGTLSVKKEKEIDTLCLRCHNRAIEARPGEVIKTVVMPAHLEEQKVKTTHHCNQCHHVHAPLQYINRAKRILGIQETS